MVQLGLLVSGGLGAVLGSITASTVKKAAIVTAAVLATVYFVGKLKTEVDGLVASFAVALPSDLVIAAGWVLPDNAVACVAAIVAAHAARWVFDLSIFGVKVKASASGG